MVINIYWSSATCKTLVWCLIISIPSIINHILKIRTSRPNKLSNLGKVKKNKTGKFGGQAFKLSKFNSRAQTFKYNIFYSFHLFTKRWILYCFPPVKKKNLLKCVFDPSQNSWNQGGGCFFFLPWITIIREHILGALFDDSIPGVWNDLLLISAHPNIKVWHLWQVESV